MKQRQIRHGQKLENHSKMIQNAYFTHLLCPIYVHTKHAFYAYGFIG